MFEHQRAVLATPRVKPIMAAALIGRLPFGMASLGIILLLRADGRSYALAGLVDGAYAVGVGLAQPLLGRAIDRFGRRAVLGPVAGAFVIAMAALAQAGSHDAATGALVPLGLAAGVTMPPLGVAMRALWPTLVAGELRGSAYSIEAVTQELAFVLGPPLVAGLAQALSPRLALFALALLAAGGTVAFVAIVPPAARRTRVAGARALASAQARVLLSLSLLLGASFGAVEVALPAFAEHHGSRAIAGLLLAALALGSALGGVAFGTRTHGANARRRLWLGLMLCGLTIAPLYLASSDLAMAGLMVLAGLPIAPTFAAQYVLLDSVAVRGAAAETFAWNSTAIFLGASLGTALGGALIAVASYRASLGLALAAGLASGTVARWRLRSFATGG
jgi:MFS family permease